MLWPVIFVKFKKIDCLFHPGFYLRFKPYLSRLSFISYLYRYVRASTVLCTVPVPVPIPVSVVYNTCTYKAFLH